jgi:NAD(P)H-flavin reductase
MKQAKVRTNQEIAFQTREVILSSDSPLIYTPGQYITLLVPKEDGTKNGRSYSIASRTNDSTITLLVRIVDGGLGSTYVKNLQEGDLLFFVGPSGKFGLSKTPRNALFIATGTGAAPFIPMIDTLLRTGNDATVTLLLGFRHEEDSFFEYMTHGWKENYPQFQGIEILSRPGSQWQGETGHVTDYIVKHSSLLTDKDLYVCGNRDMVQEVIALANQQGVPDNQIFYEKY